MKYLEDYFEKNGLHESAKKEGPVNPFDTKQMSERFKRFLSVGIGAPHIMPLKKYADMSNEKLENEFKNLKKFLFDDGDETMIPIVIVTSGFGAYHEKVLKDLEALGESTRRPIFVWGANGEEIPGSLVESVKKFCDQTPSDFESTMLGLDKLISGSMPSIKQQLEVMTMDMPEAMEKEMYLPSFRTQAKGCLILSAIKAVPVNVSNGKFKSCFAFWTASLIRLRPLI